MAKRVFWTVLFGLLATGIAVAANQIGTPIGSGKPSCSSAYRGMTWVTPGDAGVADVFELCQKYADGGFSWLATNVSGGGGGGGNSKAYANYTYVGSSEQTIASGGFTTLDINTTVTSSNITRSGNSITFGRAGAYLITVNVRFQGGYNVDQDTWTAYRLRNVADGITIATSNAFGYAALAYDDSLQYSATFLAVVTNATKTYEVQMGRDAYDGVITTPYENSTIDGEAAPTKSITIVSVD